MFVLGHCLFLVAHSFPRASLSENCSLLATDNVRGQISEHIFAPNADYLTIIPRAQMGYESIAHEAEVKSNWLVKNNFQTKHLSLVKASL